MESEYKNSQKLILTIRRDLEQLEREQYEQQQQALLNTGSSSSSEIDDAIESGLYHRGGSSTNARSAMMTHRTSSDSSSSSVPLSNIELEQRRQRLNERVTSNINTLSRGEQSLKSLVQQLGAANKSRDLWEQQISHLSNEVSFLRASTNKIFRRISEAEHARQLLLGADENYLKTGGSMDDEERMRHLHSQTSSFQRSIALVEQMKDVGSSVLGMLSSQKETIQGARRRVLDIGLMLGVSQSTIRMIERRNIIDRAIVYGGMLLVSMLLLYFFWTRVLFRKS